MQDIISRDIIVKANKESVYAAITDPAQIITWFPDAVEEGTLDVGQNPIFVFNGGSHKARVHIEKATPFEYFSYRWVPGGSNSYLDNVLDVPNTLVEFFIEEQANGTKVTVKESGFSGLPVEVAEKSFTDNTGGWAQMMTRLENKLTQA